MMWASKTLPQSEQLNKFVSIQKHCIINALQWLVVDNPLYENIQINHHLLKTCENKFIPSSIINSIVHRNSNQHKRKAYTTDLNDGNFENDLDAAIAGTGIEENHINSSYIYSNIDNQRKNSTLQPLFAVANIKPTVSSIDQPTLIIISYCSSS